MRLFVSVTNENVKDWYVAGDSWLLTEYASLEELAAAVATEITEWIQIVDVNALSPAKMITLRLSHIHNDQEYGAAHCIVRKEWDYLTERVSALETLFHLLISMVKVQARTDEK